MKYLNVRIIVVTWVMILNLFNLTAQVRTSDYLVFGATGGYSTMYGKAQEMTVPGRVSGGLQFGYEIRHGNFLFRMPLEVIYFTSSCNTDITIPDQLIQDTRLTDAILHYKMLSPLSEVQRFVIPNIGFMFGYSGNDYQDCQLNGSFYLLAGFKVFRKFDVHNSVNLKYATTATYEKYIDDYEDIPNHFYTNHESDAKVKLGSQWGLMGALDMGWELNVNDYDKLKIGAFVNIGLTNIMYGVERETCHTNPEDAVDVMLASYYQSPAMENKFVVPFMVGVSCSYALNMNRIYNCRSHAHSKRCLAYRRVRRHHRR